VVEELAVDLPDREALGGEARREVEGREDVGPLAVGDDLAVWFGLVGGVWEGVWDRVAGMMDLFGGCDEEGI
jgi:hypothetical protein